MVRRELWVVESKYLPTGADFAPIIFGIGYTEQHACSLAAQHERKYPKEPCRVVRYIPEDVFGTS